MQYGIPSFAPNWVPSDSPGWLDEHERVQFAERVEETTIRDAANDILADHEYRSEVLGEIHDVNRDNWRILASDAVSGRCLDLSAGYGRRSMALAELVDEVYTVDPDLMKLRVVSARKDYESRSRVIPVHAELDRLPFSSKSFDTVVADLTGSNGRNLRDLVCNLRRFLTDDGTVVLILDGWTRRLGIPSFVGLERRPPGGRGDLLPATPHGYRSVLESAGLEVSDVYALFPTAQSVEYVFNVNSKYAVRALQRQVREVVSENDHRHSAASAAMRLGDRLGALEYGYPSYCVIGSVNRSTPSKRSAVEYTDPFLISGRTRSVVLDFENDALAKVLKIPNREAHAPVTEREIHVLSALRATGEPIVETLPVGHSVQSRFGTIRCEEPVEGRPLKDQISGDIESFRRMLRIGLGWLAEFQQTFGGETVVRSPAEVEADLSFPPLDLHAPEVDASVELFRTPVHGDYLIENVYVRNGAVTNVIDWEYGALSGWPTIDAGLFPLNVAKYVFGSVEAGFRAIFCDDNEYARATEEIVHDYCETVGLEYQAYLLYLPSIYLHRIAIGWEHDTMSTYTDKLNRRISRIKLLQNVLIESMVSAHQRDDAHSS